MNAAVRRAVGCSTPTTAALARTLGERRRRLEGTAIRDHGSTRPTGSARAPRWLLASLTALVSVSIVAVATEALLRLRGRSPWRYATLDAREPVMNELDPVRGWRNRPGVYVVPPYTQGGVETTHTVLPDGSRATSRSEQAGRPRLLVVGGSVTRGSGISDADTFAWKLQRRFPGLHVVNHGTGGYGTFQSLLTLEEVLPRGRPAFVLYAFIDHHVVRNVAPPRWIELLARHSRHRQVAVPFCTLDETGRLVRHLPTRHPVLPLREHLATVAFLERLVAEARGRGRSHQQRAVTEALLLEMRDLAGRHGAGLAVVQLSGRRDVAAHYRSFLRGAGVRSVDCVRELSDRLRVPGEGHPNGRAHTLWADCIEAKLGDGLDRLNPPAPTAPAAKAPAPNAPAAAAAPGRAAAGGAAVSGGRD